MADNRLPATAAVAAVAGRVPLCRAFAAGIGSGRCEVLQASPAEAGGDLQ